MSPSASSPFYLTKTSQSTTTLSLLSSPPSKSLDGQSSHKIHLFEKRPPPPNFLFTGRPSHLPPPPYKSDMDLIELSTDFSDLKVNQLCQEVDNLVDLVGHQSEPATPPEYHESSAFASSFVRPNRFSLSSLNSLFPHQPYTPRSSRSGSIVFARTYPSAPPLTAGKIVSVSSRNSDEDDDHPDDIRDEYSSFPQKSTSSSASMDNNTSALPRLDINTYELPSVTNCNDQVPPADCFKDDNEPMVKNVKFATRLSLAGAVTHANSRDSVPISSDARRSFFEMGTTDDEFPVLLHRNDPNITYSGNTSGINNITSTNNGSNAIYLDTLSSTLPSDASTSDIWNSIQRHRPGYKSLPINSLASSSGDFQVPSNAVINGTMSSNITGVSVGNPVSKATVVTPTAAAAVAAVASYNQNSLQAADKYSSSQTHRSSTALNQLSRLASFPKSHSYSTNDMLALRNIYENSCLDSNDTNSISPSGLVSPSNLGNSAQMSCDIPLSGSLILSQVNEENGIGEQKPKLYHIGSSSHTHLSSLSNNCTATGTPGSPISFGPELDNCPSMFDGSKFALGGGTVDCNNVTLSPSYVTRKGGINSIRVRKYSGSRTFSVCPNVGSINTSTAPSVYYDDLVTLMSPSFATNGINSINMNSPLPAGSIQTPGLSNGIGSTGVPNNAGNGGMAAPIRNNMENPSWVNGNCAGSSGNGVDGVLIPLYPVTMNFGNSYKVINGGYKRGCETGLVNVNFHGPASGQIQGQGPSVVAASRGHGSNQVHIHGSGHPNVYTHGHAHPHGHVHAPGNPHGHGGVNRSIHLQMSRRATSDEEVVKFINASLDAFIGQIYDMCKDQQGCRFLQKKLEEKNADNVRIIFEEVQDHVVELMTDPFGNYLCQKLFERADDEQRLKLISSTSQDMLRIGLNQHGTRALQKMIELVSETEQIKIIIEAVKDNVVDLIQDLNGNHMVQKFLNHLAAVDSQFIFDAVGKNCVSVGTHRHGCCVLQRCIDHANEQQKSILIERITEEAFILVQDPFGNYVIQYILDLGKPRYTEPLCLSFKGHVPTLSRQKFSSNVIEKCIRCASASTRRFMVEELMQANELDSLIKGAYGNYVVQTAIEHSEPGLRARLCEEIRPIILAIRNTPHGRRILQKIHDSDQRLATVATVVTCNNEVSDSEARLSASISKSDSTSTMAMTSTIAFTSASTVMATATATPSTTKTGAGVVANISKTAGYSKVDTSIPISNPLEGNSSSSIVGGSHHPPSTCTSILNTVSTTSKPTSSIHCESPPSPSEVQVSRGRLSQQIISNMQMMGQLPRTSSQINIMNVSGANSAPVPTSSSLLTTSLPRNRSEGQFVGNNFNILRGQGRPHLQSRIAPSTGMSSSGVSGNTNTGGGIGGPAHPGLGSSETWNSGQAGVASVYSGLFGTFNPCAAVPFQTGTGHFPMTTMPPPVNRSSAAYVHGHGYRHAVAGPVVGTNGSVQQLQHSLNMSNVTNIVQGLGGGDGGRSNYACHQQPSHSHARGGYFHGQTPSSVSQSTSFHNLPPQTSNGVQYF